MHSTSEPTLPGRCIFDGHNDSLTQIFQPGRGQTRSFFVESRDGHIDLPRARKGGLNGGFFAIFTPPDSPERDLSVGLTITEGGYVVSPRSPIEQPYAQAFTNAILDFASDIEAKSRGHVRIVKTAAELEQCFADRTFAMVLHIEGAEAIRQDLSNLEVYYRRGVRSLGLVWSRPNVFGHGVPFMYPHSPDTGPGLFPAGKALVKACNRLGILVDLAHLNEKGFWDVVDITNAPLVVTHADVYSICPSTRNLTDDQIDAIGQSGGVIGINFEVANTHPAASLESDVPLAQVTRHIDYVVNRIGIDHVAFGSDFDGADMPDGLKDVTGLPNLIAQLSANGYSAEELDKITYKNWLRVLKATWTD